MGQDEETGRQAAEDGKAIAWSIADALGVMLREPDKSNRCSYDGKAAVIKSAQRGNRNIEITRVMFPELDFALVAIEVLPGYFDVFEVPRKVLDSKKRTSTGWKSRDTQLSFETREILEGLKPIKRVQHVEYRIELYWPVEDEREFQPDYALWVHDSKVERINRIPTGSKILFYETEKDSWDEGDGAKRAFAAGTLTDHHRDEPQSFKDDQGRNWRESRLVRLERWTPPKRGITLDEIRAVLKKPATWKMRMGPYPILPHQYREIAGRLPEISAKGKPAVAASTTSAAPVPGGKDEFRSVSQKDEDDSIRDQAADRVQIRKIHNQLVNKFAQFARDSLRLQPEEDRFDVLLRLDGDAALLIEAKSASAGGQGRHQIRQAIGQLFDYRHSNWARKRDRITLAVLLPDRPAEDVLELLDTLDIGAIWRLGDGFAATDKVRRQDSRFERFVPA